MIGVESHRNGRKKMLYTDGIHLIGDSLKELHDFAKFLGLKREWFQYHPRNSN